MAEQIVCTSPQCKEAHALCDQMRYTLDNLASSYSDFNYAIYKPAVDAISEAESAKTHWYESLIPFNSDCCALDTIGAQAAALTNQMLASVGAVEVPKPPAGQDWTNLLLIGGAILLLAVYSPQIKKAFG